jgi:hypothetical protein
MSRAAAQRMRAVRESENQGGLEWQGVVRTVERRGADFRRCAQALEGMGFRPPAGVGSPRPEMARHC